MKASEHQEQKAVVDWCKKRGIPVAAVPNGFHVQKRDAKFYGMLNALKAEGFSSGFPDLIVFPSDKILFIEMKVRQGGTVSDKQKEWHETLTSLGHDVSVCHGAEQAIDKIEGCL